MGEQGRPGRKRSQRAHRAILKATVNLMAKRGYAGFTIEAVAERAGLGKQTIYRWWSGKGTLVREAYSDLAAREVPIPDTGAVREDLRGS